MRIVHNTERQRYELFEDETLASVVEYRPAGDRIVFDHTETARTFRGRGLAAVLVEWALNDVRKRRLSVVPQCSFVADFLEKHPEFEDLRDKDYAPSR
jgi:predicted GNAT family acetyltransferase